MFYIFYDNEEIGCWVNQKGDIFYDSTIDQLSKKTEFSDRNKFSMVFFDDNKNIDAHSFERTINYYKKFDEHGNIIEFCLPEIYVLNGEKFLLC